MDYRVQFDFDKTFFFFFIIFSFSDGGAGFDLSMDPMMLRFQS